MSERGKALYSVSSVGSNTVAKRAPGSLYSITTSGVAGSIVRIDDAHSFNQGVLDINASSSNTIGRFLGSVNTVFGKGIGFNTGLDFAASSNSTVTLEYE